jgi:ubiquinone/menaquinone biosynthesis C-methylase UbiE
MQAPLKEISVYHQIRHTYDASRSMIWCEICQYLKRFVSENSTVLDLGAGYGDFLQHIRAEKKYGLELNKALIQHWPDDVKPIIQSALDPFPINDHVISVVFASNFFEHFLIEECRVILTEVFRVLKPGGVLIAIQPNIRLQPGRYYEDYTHKTPFTEVSFCDFLESLGWCILKCESSFLPLTMKLRIPKWRWLVRLYLALPFKPFAGQFLIVAERPSDA